MIVSTSVKGAPARINRRMFSTDSEESKPEAFCAYFVLNGDFAGDCVEDSISSSFSMPLSKGELTRAEGLIVVWNCTATLVNSTFAGYSPLV